MKKIVTIVLIFLTFIIGGYFLYNFLFLNQKNNIKHALHKYTKTVLKKNKDNNKTKKYKYINPNVKSNFHRPPVKIKSVFSKKEKQAIENGTLYKDEDIKANKKIDISENEIKMLKEKVKEPYYFTLLDWKFGGTNNNVLMISFQVYNLTNKNYNGLVDIKCSTLDKANNKLGEVEDEVFITVGANSKRIYKDEILGITSSVNVKKVNCDFIYSQDQEKKSTIKQNTGSVNTSIDNNKNISTEKKEENFQPPLNLFE